MSSNKKSRSDEQVREQRAAWNTTKRVAPFIWPKGDFDLRARVVLALLALVG